MFFFFNFKCDNVFAPILYICDSELVYIPSQVLEFLGVEV